MTIFDILIWVGAAMTLIGVFALLYCIVLVNRARRANLPEDAVRARMRSALAINMGALALSTVGLLLVVTGIMLKP